MSEQQNKVFVCYRRLDTGGDAGRLDERLRERFGDDTVFLDAYSIASGVNFREHIVAAIKRSRVVLVLIGPAWLDAQRRLDDPADDVRIEIETALSTPGTKVIPVLVAGASMPAPDQLPEGVRPLVHLHAAQLRRNPDFNQDAAKLLDDLAVLVPSSTPLSGVERGTAHSFAYLADEWKKMAKEDLPEILKFRECVVSAAGPGSWLEHEVSKAASALEKKLAAQEREVVQERRRRRLSLVKAGRDRPYVLAYVVSALTIAGAFAAWLMWPLLTALGRGPESARLSIGYIVGFTVAFLLIVAAPMFSFIFAPVRRLLLPCFFAVLFSSVAVVGVAILPAVEWRDFRSVAAAPAAIRDARDARISSIYCYAVRISAVARRSSDIEATSVAVENPQLPCLRDEAFRESVSQEVAARVVKDEEAAMFSLIAIVVLIVIGIVAIRISSDKPT